MILIPVDINKYNLNLNLNYLGDVQPPSVGLLHEGVDDAGWREGGEEGKGG